jgi:hypothetical protein
VRRWRLATVALIAVALTGATACPAALADGDPASDVLLAESVFFPYHPASARLERELVGVTTVLARAGDPLKVAIIQSPADLGAITPAFGKPRAYATFLEAELSASHRQPLLVVMADGYGTAGLGAAASAVVSSLPPPSGGSSDELAEAALQAARQIASAEGHPISSSVSAFSALRAVLVVLLAGGALLTALALLLMGVQWGGKTAGAHFHSYFAADSGRITQTALGLLWLTDGGLQLQRSMYSQGFVDSLRAHALSQPVWIAASIKWSAHIIGLNLAAWNTLFALIALLIGFGLLWRPAVKLGLVGTLVWAPLVWWFGEGFGMLFTGSAQPLAGAPGAALLYVLVALVAWPTAQAGGLVGVRGLRLAWGGLWLSNASLWLFPSSSATGAAHNIINSAPSGMSWLTSLQNGSASAMTGAGIALAAPLAVVSAAIGLLAFRTRWARAALIAAIALNLVYWLLGEGLGGVLQGGASDLGTAPLFILLAFCVSATARPLPD